MGEKKPQTFKNHKRTDPMYVYVLGGLLLIILVRSIMTLVRHHGHQRSQNITVVLIALALFVIAALMRGYSNKVQDRVIRLEERIRLMSILPTLLHHRIDELSVSQLVALRFASDKELMALTARVFEEKLDNRQIKEAIVDWRPDYLRV